MPSADDDAAHVLRIGGMTCGHCVGAVTSALEGVAGVARADVDLERGLATVAAAPGASLALADLVDAVEASGFDASDAAGGGGAATTQTLAVEGMSCGQCEAWDGDDATWSVVELRVEGMTCAACASRVAKALRSLGVDDISVNCVTDVATFRALGASPALVTRAVAAVKQAGYASSPDTARVEAEGEKAASDDPHVAKTTLATKGMICPSCPPRIQRALKRLDGVRDVTVFLVLDAVELGYDASVQADDDGVDVAGEERARKLARVAEVRAFRRRAAVAFALAAPVFVVMMLVIPYGARDAVLALQSNALAGGAATSPLRYGTANMDVLVALGTSAAYFYSIYVLYEALLSLQPKMATVSHTMDDGGDYEEVVDAGSLSRGDVVKIKPGEAVPADGAVVSGESNCDESMLTGESMPVEKRPADDDKEAAGKVYGGTINAGPGVLFASVARGFARRRRRRRRRRFADALLDAVGVAEGGSEHPLASALVATAAEARGGGLAGPAVQRRRLRRSSAGVSRRCARTTPRRRSSCSTWARGTSSPRPAAAAALSARARRARALEAGGAAVVFVHAAVGGRRLVADDFRATAKKPPPAGSGDVVGMIGVADIIRDEAARVVSHLQSNLGIEVWMLTGDNERTAQAIARQCGISRVLAKANLFFSLAFNGLGIPIAAGALYPFLEVRLPPEVAAPPWCSSVSVVASSLSLRSYKPPSASPRAGDGDPALCSCAVRCCSVRFHCGADRATRSSADRSARTGC
ncbi:cation-transporting ATPase [Aureococcus anophagefferens]|nr:cation-transporting ATPase [Aureococcus anophagefferens]